MRNSNLFCVEFGCVDPFSNVEDCPVVRWWKSYIFEGPMFVMRVFGYDQWLEL